MFKVDTDEWDQDGGAGHPMSAMDGNLKTVIKTSAHSDINVLQAKAEKWEKATAQYINAPKYNNPGGIFGRSNWPPKKGRLCIWGIFFS